jgi:hypothetical protein
MSPEPTLREAIMDLAVDDYTGLWELRWRAATLFPDNTEEAERDAREEAERLVAEGLLALYDVAAGGEPAPIPTAAALATIRNPDAWAEPTEAHELRVAATPEGEKAYQEGRLAPA